MGTEKKRTSKKKLKRGRPAKNAKLLLQLKKLGVFRIQDAKRLGISQPSLSRLVAAEKITRLGAGFYVHPDSSVKPEDYDYIVTCARFGPTSAIGGLTALFHYGLIEQVPHRIWVVVPHNRRANAPLYRCIRTKTNPRKGIEDHGHYRITNLERTLVEAFKYASKVGLRVALRATRTALIEKRTTLPKIFAQAKELELERVIARHWEAIVPEGQAA